jgi:hypothetical protein
MIINLIDKMYHSGELLHLIRAGFISPNVLIYRKIYHSHAERIEAGRKKTQAIDDVCLTFEYERRHVYTILKFMSQEYKPQETLISS